MFPWCQGSPCSLPQSHSKACLSAGVSRLGLQVCHMDPRWPEAQGQAATLAPAGELDSSRDSTSHECPRTMAVTANAKKYLVISMWAPSCHCPHFTDDKVSRIGKDQCITVCLHRALKLMLRTMMVGTVSQEKQPEPCCPSGMPPSPNPMCAALHMPPPLPYYTLTSPSHHGRL